MANSISDTLEEYWSKLPNAINGNGQNFIYLLKDMLGDLTDQLNDKFEEISKIANAFTDAPETITSQLQNCKIEETRVGTAITFTLSWDSSNIDDYSSAEIYIKYAEGNSSTAIDWSSIDWMRTITTAEKARSCVVDNINAGYVYRIMFRGKDIYGSVSRESDAPYLTYTVSAMNNIPDAPVDFDVYFNRTQVTWKWQQPVDLDYSYSELRLNENVGEAVGLLEVTQDNYSHALPEVREGTAYLYNKGYGDKYSEAITKAYSKPVPTAPDTVEIVTTYQGLQITYSEIPDNCTGAVIMINGLRHYSNDEKFNYYCSTGTYTVKVCYYDCFGEGTWSEEQTVSTVEEIPSEAIHITDKVVFDDGVIVASYIGDKQIVGTKIQDGTITTANIAAGAITADQLGANSVTADAIDADAITADKIATGAVTADAIESSAVTADKIASGSITTAKLAADSINLSGALKVVGGNVTLDENGLTTACADGSNVLFDGSGMSFVDSLGNVFAGIGRFIAGYATDGQTVTFINEWDTTPTVLVFPMELQTNAVGYTDVNVYQQVLASNITTSGFTMYCRSILKSGSGASVLVGSKFANVSSKENMSVDKTTSWYSYTFTVPSTITSFTGNLQIGTTGNTVSWSGSEDSGSVSCYCSAQVYWTKDGTTVGSTTTPINSVTGSKTVTVSQTISCSGNTTIKAYVRFIFTTKGETVSASRYGTLSYTGTATAVSYTTNKTGDIVIHKGKAAFIACDAQAGMYTAS